MEEIDLVYLWVDGSDPQWIAKHNALTASGTAFRDADCKGRYADSGELKFSLRSVEKYAPWIHRIFIVTDNQIPSWLDVSNPKVQIVDHTAIMPAESLPCFNSRIIEHHLHNIPGLSEKFIYANDDMLLNKPVSPSSFFAEDGLPIMRFNRRICRKFTLFFKEKVMHRRPSTYLKAISNSAGLVEAKYGVFYGGKTHHNMDAYLKSTYAYARETFKAEIDATLQNHERSDKDIQRNLYNYVAVAEGKAHLKYVTSRTSFRFHIEKAGHYAKLARYNPTFFCMNDSQYCNDNDRRRAAEFLASKFPDKSKFEK
ncbi:MAG: Stealth CR1 domain-containing protein [Bacteroidales bacterium]|nr:Stealth CR1 domain-containing protein [Bacteroidales bacterium]